ncbi:hypothetical protein BV898_19313 [Hypsibius exemplaris]|uniref:Uncharacterized protein n=1 Tax=Hypsibius exemplaris TaxID=2072580 RepID=A0A9X6NQH7_HYPEX|nr:hypothetical protein BV898_19313 [Hypsibius exemplaris]
MQSFVALTFFAVVVAVSGGSRFSRNAETPQEACDHAIAAALSKNVSDHLQIQANKESAFAAAAQNYIIATEVVDKALSDARANVATAQLVAAAAVVGSPAEVVANNGLATAQTAEAAALTVWIAIHAPADAARLTAENAATAAALVAVGVADGLAADAINAARAYCRFGMKRRFNWSSFFLRQFLFYSDELG